MCYQDKIFFCYQDAISNVALGGYIYLNQGKHPLHPSSNIRKISNILTLWNLKSVIYKCNDLHFLIINREGAETVCISVHIFNHSWSNHVSYGIEEKCTLWDNILLPEEGIDQLNQRRGNVSLQLTFLTFIKFNMAGCISYLDKSNFNQFTQFSLS